MQKIKASEILKMNPELTLDILKGYKYYAVDSDSVASLFRHEPYVTFLYWVGSPWLELSEVENVENWAESLREIEHENNS